MTSTVTLYKLFLGDQSTSPPYHYRRGFTIHSITAAVFPNGGNFHSNITGYVTSYTPIGFTEYDVSEGGVILDSFGNYYQINTVKPWTSGDTFCFNELGLEKLRVFPFMAGFFGFEDEDHGTVGGMFEEGFERGQWAL